MKNLWVFDLDNTLISSSIDYGRAYAKFLALILDRLEHKAPHYDEIHTLFAGIEKEQFKAMRASRDRFPASMVVCYRRICQRIGLIPDPTVEEECLKIGQFALSEENYKGRTLIPGAEETLEFLKEKGDGLFCVTAGDPVVQWRKYQGYNLERFFPLKPKGTFIVVEWEKGPSFEQLRKRFPNQKIFAVGDSVGSDLVPAAKAGLIPVFVPHPSVWDHGELVKEIPPGTIVLEKISDLIEKYKELP